MRWYFFCETLDVWFFFFLKGAIEVNIIYLLILLVHDFNSIQWYAVWQFDSVVFLKLQFVLCTEPGGREA